MKFEGAVCHLTRNELQALCEFASRDFTRPQLEAIWFDPDRGRTFATDGHRLAVLESKDPGDGACYAVSSEILLRVWRVFSLRPNDQLPIEPTADGLRIVCPPWPAGRDAHGELLRRHGLTVLLDPLRECEPPPIDGLLDSIDEFATPAPLVTINAAYLASVQALCMLSHNNSQPAVWQHGDELDPIRIDAEVAEGRAFALIMPMRGSANRSVTCVACGIEFVPARRDGRYCSSKCRQQAHRDRQSAQLSRAQALAEQEAEAAE